MAAAVDCNCVPLSTGGCAPLFLANSKLSGICVVDNLNYNTEVTVDVQEILRKQNIVITDSAGLDVAFNLHGLNTVANVDQKSEIQGMVQQSLSLLSNCSSYAFRHESTCVDQKSFVLPVHRNPSRFIQHQQFGGRGAMRT